MKRSISRFPYFTLPRLAEMLDVKTHFANSFPPQTVVTSINIHGFSVGAPAAAKFVPSHKVWKEKQTRPVLSINLVV